MSSETSNSSGDKEHAKEQELTTQESVLKDAVDPRDLVMKPKTTQEPEELVTNPAVTPQMPNAPGDLRDDLKKD